MRRAHVQAPGTAAASGASGPKLLRAMLFGWGDCAFLLLIGALSTSVMRLAHGWSRNFVLATGAGMTVTMLVQMLLAMAVAPLLGSLESMVPSMIVAMVSPMAICALDLAGYSPGWAGTAGVGAGLALGFFIFIELYGVKCRRSFRRTYPAG